jgi:hypothetical protein
MQILPVEEDLFRADGQTDMAKLRDSFCNFANQPKKGLKGVKAHSRLTIFLHVGIQRLASLNKEHEHNL